MAFTHIQLSINSTHGPGLRGVLNSLQAAHRGLADQIEIMKTMIDGDGSSAAQFPEVTARYGFQSDAQSKAAFDELNSVSFKLHTDTQITAMDAAIKQVLSKFG